MVRVPDTKSDCSCRGEAEVRILDFKTTWLEFKKPCQTAAVQGKAEQLIYNLKNTSSTQSRSQAVVCVSTTRMYLRSGYILVTFIYSLIFDWNLSLRFWQCSNFVKICWTWKLLNPLNTKKDSFMYLITLHVFDYNKNFKSDWYFKRLSITSLFLQTTI